MKNLWLAVCIVMGLGLIGCSDEIKIENFDNQKWKEDPNGCNGNRAQLRTALMASQSQLIGRNLMEIKNLLGKPDGNDLRTRGQKFFEYGIQGGSICDRTRYEQPEILRIRFDALDRVTEISVY